MATLRLGEVIVDAVVAKLQAGWEARADAVNIEKSDGIMVATPAPAYFFVGRMQELPATPAVFVLEGPAVFGESGAHSMCSTYEIHVHIVEADRSGPLLARRLMRQARVVIETLYDDSPQEALYVSGSNTVKSAFRIFPIRTVPGAVFEPQAGDSWRGTYLIVFRAEQEEL